MSRTFEDKPAVRESVPLLFGLFGPSGSGKTFSALRLATGIQQVTGGDIYYIDTEARRALHYADKFKFRHVQFEAPFGPLDYLEAVEHCVGKGAKVVVVDSMSHEHEGPGGVLEMHEAEMQRLGGNDKMKFLAWQKPKQERRRFINSILQMPANFIFCFRAKEKLKLERGKDPQPMGYMPIAGEEFVFEMTVNCLLLPRADGVPCWDSGYQGESYMMKLPAQFRELLMQKKALDEEIGKILAEWARGGVSRQAPAPTPAPPSTKSSGDNAGLLKEIAKAIKKAAEQREGDSKEQGAAIGQEYFGCATWEEIKALPTDRLENGLLTLKAKEEIL